MRFIVVLAPKAGANEADFARHSLSEERHVWKMYVNGILRHMYFQEDPVRVVLDFEADDRGDVQSELKALPMVEAGLFSIEIIQLGPWLPISVLFGPQADGA
jgi:hypothetical protein